MDNMLDILPIPELMDNTIIKVLGVGGGGCNAVNYMYRQGIKDVSFLVCNTDSMALEKMSVPAKLQIGPGLGAGGEPEVAEDFAANNEERIREALNDGTRMVFITAGMGGGTGTGASPVVARIAHEMDILTVGIVTIPFAFEGKRAIRKALRGVATLAQYTDALLVINNEKLKLLFKDLDLPNAFQKADEVLCNAAKSIAEIITIPGYINTDFQDVKNTLKNGNMAIMNVGVGEGENRITKAIENALNSPLVNTNNVHGASRILLNFYCSTDHAICMQELSQVDEFRESVGEDVEVKWGATYDDSLGEKVRVTIIATGYQVSDIPGLDDAVETVETTLTQGRNTKSISSVETLFYPPKTDGGDTVSTTTEVKTAEEVTESETESVTEEPKEQPTEEKQEEKKEVKTELPKDNTIFSIDDWDNWDSDRYKQMDEDSPWVRRNR